MISPVLPGIGWLEFGNGLSRRGTVAWLSKNAHERKNGALFAGLTPYPSKFIFPG